MHIFLALTLTLALLIQPATPPDDSAFCEWLDYVDTHYDVIASFSPDRAYDLLAYPVPLANQVAARLVEAGCDY